MKMKLAASTAFILTILAANYFTAHYGLIPVGFGLVATAGTFFAGLTFVLRDLVQDLSGRRWVIILILIGAALSFLVTIGMPRIALASGIAFLIAELADLAIYTPLRKRGYVRAAVASNFIGSLLDTIVFLAIAGFPIIPALPGQMLAKMTVTAVVVLLVVGARVVLREPVKP